MKIGAAVMVLGRWFGLSRPFGTLGEEKICITTPLKQTRVCVVNFMKLFSREGFVTTKLDVVLWFRMSLVCVFTRKSASVSEQEPGTLCLRFCSISCLLVWIGGKFRVTAPHLSGIFFFLSATLTRKKVRSWSYTLTQPLIPTLTAEIRSHVNPRKICIRRSDLNGPGMMAVGSGILVRPHCHPGRHLGLSPMRARGT